MSLYNRPMRFYLAGRYDRHPEMEQFAKELRSIGDEVTCEWITGKHDNTPYEQCAQQDLTDLFDSNGLILFGDDLVNTPECSERGVPLVPAKWATGGRHVEFGVILCTRILYDAQVPVPFYRLVVVDHKQNVFHHLSNFVEFYPSLQDFITQRQQELSQVASA
jgi:hypothetical protein